MKNTYSLSIMLFAALLLFSCTEITETSVEVNDDSEQCSCSSKTGDTTHLAKAKTEIGYYRLGLEMMPETFTWNGDTIHYTPRFIAKQHTRDSIDTLIKLYKKEKGHHNSTEFPFSDSSSLAKSYFIHRDDIHQLNELINSNDQVNGIRIYMAAKANSMNSSHIFLGPAQRNINQTRSGGADTTYTDYYLKNETKKYLYDLTTPCPNACGGKMNPLPN